MRQLHGGGAVGRPEVAEHDLHQFSHGSPRVLEVFDRVGVAVAGQLPAASTTAAGHPPVARCTASKWTSPATPQASSTAASSVWGEGEVVGRKPDDAMGVAQLAG